MAVRDGIDVGVLAMLSGHTGDRERAARSALAMTVLGVGLGAHVDLGVSDAAILELCRNGLRVIMASIADPTTMGALDDRAIPWERTGWASPHCYVCVVEDAIDRARMEKREAKVQAVGRPDPGELVP